MGCGGLILWILMGVLALAALGAVLTGFGYR